MDELADALPTCPQCLHRLELAGVQDGPGERLYGVCACGITPLTD